MHKHCYNLKFYSAQLALPKTIGMIINTDTPDNIVGALVALS